MTLEFHVNANLVGATCFKLQLYQGGYAVALQHFIVCYGMLAVTPIGKGLE